MPMARSPLRDDLLRWLAERPPRTTVHVAGADGAWAQVQAHEGSRLTLGAATTMAVDAVRAFVVVYANGEVLSSSVPPPTRLPAGTHFARPAAAGHDHRLSREQVARASTSVVVRFEPKHRRTPDGQRLYATTVANQGREPIRVTHFAAYVEVGGGWQLRTITDGFFTAEQFTEWYGAPADGWIAPGGSVVDPENYGEALWVYYFETHLGQTGMAAGRAPR